jgi:prepilin-type N-terminal cleavage/methylation domain-containing protein
MKAKAFTLTELLICIAIILVLIGLVFPSVMEAKRSSQETVCMSNLRQIQQALAIYRTDYGGDGLYGPASQMGLPLPSTDLIRVLKLPLAVFHCPAPPNVMSPKQAVYVAMYDDPPSSGKGSGWGDYVRAVSENAVLFADMNHGDRSVPISSPFYVHKGIGVRLSGSIVKCQKAGNWSDHWWWPQ